MTEQTEPVEVPQEFIDKYNPNNAAGLSADEVAAMEGFTDEQIKALAKAYPNTPQGNAFIVLKDSNNKAKQLYPRSTYANLLNLRKGGGKNWVIAGFAKGFKVPGVGTAQPGLKVAPAQDLTRTQLKEELKQNLGKLVDDEPTEKLHEINEAIKSDIKEKAEKGVDAATNEKPAGENEGAALNEGEQGAQGTEPGENTLTGKEANEGSITAEGEVIPPTGEGAGEPSAEEFPDLSNEAAAAAENGNVKAEGDKPKRVNTRGAGK